MGRCVHLSALRFLNHGKVQLVSLVFIEPVRQFGSSTMKQLKNMSQALARMLHYHQEVRSARTARTHVKMLSRKVLMVAVPEGEECLNRGALYCGIA